MSFTRYAARILFCLVSPIPSVLAIYVSHLQWGEVSDAKKLYASVVVILLSPILVILGLSLCLSPLRRKEFPVALLWGAIILAASPGLILLLAISKSQ
jgi:hypothetical protein